MTAKIADSIEKNRSHHNDLYSRADLKALMRKIENYEVFLADAATTDASWVGLYVKGIKQQLRGATVLELGCGRGLNALIMAALGAEVTAIDISEESAKIVRLLSQALELSTRITAYSGDFRKMWFAPRSFDFVVGKAFLHHLVYELEEEILSKVSDVLKPEGEARFVEPAVNSKLLDQIRWLIPVSGRPSVLQKKAFYNWKKHDVHPERNNSSDHYRRLARRYFQEVEIIPYGGIERCYRFFPNGALTRKFRRWAFRIEKKLPPSFNMRIARCQTIICHKPKIEREVGSSLSQPVGFPHQVFGRTGIGGSTRNRTLLRKDA